MECPDFSDTMSEIDLNLVPPAPAKGGVPFLLIVSLFLIGIAIGYFLAKYSFRKILQRVIDDKTKMEKNVRFAEPVERAVYRSVPNRFPEPVTIRMSDLMHRSNMPFGGPSKVEEVHEPEPVSEIQPVEPEPETAPEPEPERVEQRTLEGESERVPEKEPERILEGESEKAPAPEPKPEPEPKPTKPKTKRAPRKKPAPAPSPEPERVSEEKPETVSEEKPEMPASTEVIV